MNSKGRRLAERLAVSLGREISEGKLRPGEHLVAQTIADQHGVSRFPVNEALGLLIEQGFARKEANRGVFVADSGEAVSSPSMLDADPVEQAYFKIAEDRLEGRLPPIVSAKLIHESYGLTQSQVQALLTRIIKEGCFATAVTRSRSIGSGDGPLGDISFVLVERLFSSHGP